MSGIYPYDFEKYPGDTPKSLFQCELAVEVETSRECGDPVIRVVAVYHHEDPALEYDWMLKEFRHNGKGLPQNLINKPDLMLRLVGEAGARGAVMDEDFRERALQDVREEAA